MVNYPSLDVQTHHRRRPSDPGRSTLCVQPPPKPSLRTPRSGRNLRVPSSRATPYKKPEEVILSDGSPMVLFTPKQYMADKADKEARQRKLSITPSPMLSPGSKGSTTQPRTPLFPSQLRSRQSSSALAPVPVMGTPQKVRRPQDPARPRVQLLRVLNQCLDDDMQNEVRWTVRNGLSNGRSEERDRSGMWSPLSGAVHKVWPNLRGWIMSHTPSDDNIDWATGAERIGYGDEWCIEDPDIATKHSSPDPVGFYMSPTSYDAARKLVQTLAGREIDFRNFVDSGINPFFLIYACADCGVLLPANFSLELLWKHLDAIIRAKCWRGLGSGKARAQHSTRSDVANVPRKFSQKDPSKDPRRDVPKDPERIVDKLLSFSLGARPPAPAPDRGPVHQLQIAIDNYRYRWAMRAHVGTLWYQAGDLDDNDIAPFAVMDALTRVLPYCQGGILEIQTNDVQLMWGVYGVTYGAPSGAPPGAWLVVDNVCKSFQVDLRAKWAELKRLSTPPLADPSEMYTIPQRDPAVVNVVLDKLRVMRGDAFQTMARHLTV